MEKQNHAWCTETGWLQWVILVKLSSTSCLPQWLTDCCLGPRFNPVCVCVCERKKKKSKGGESETDRPRRKNKVIKVVILEVFFFFPSLVTSLPTCTSQRSVCNQGMSSTPWRLFPWILCEVKMRFGFRWAVLFSLSAQPWWLSMLIRPTQFFFCCNLLTETRNMSLPIYQTLYRERTTQHWVESLLFIWKRRRLLC